MKKVKRVLAALLASAMLLGLAACGNASSTPTEGAAPDDTAGDTTANQPADDGDANADDGAAAEADPNKPYAGETVRIVVSDTQAEGNEMNDLVDLVLERTGIILEFDILASSADGEVDRTLVALQAGEPKDIIYGTAPALKTYYNAGVLEAIDDMAAARGYDFANIYAEGTLPTYDDGKTYGLPAFNDIWLTFINTKWFNELDIEIPSADEWTWDKYEEIAAQITNAGLTNADGEKVWGGFMETYNCYYYMLAVQKGAGFYKEDGTSNFDDPLFREAMEWYAGLGNEKKIQPDITNMRAGTYAWNQFVANDDMAMFICGGWVASMLSNTEQYARDWECAILPMPYPAGEQPSTLTVPGCYAIPTTSQNKDAAFEVIITIAEEMYTLGQGRVPAKVLSEDELNDYVDNVLVPTVFANDAVSAEDIKVAWFSPDRALLPEKIVGPADGMLLEIVKSEGDLYGTNAQDLDTTMARLLESANKAIEEAVE